MATNHEQSAREKRVGIWIRVSTDEQAHNESPEHHELRARHYAESKGWTVMEVYDLRGVSGKTVEDHPETRRMMADIKRGHIGGLIFSKLARLGRNVNELLRFADYFQTYNADLISLQESIDTSTPAGRLFYTMIAAMAHWEREESASRTSAMTRVRAEMGKSLGGPAPFGYQWVDKKLMPHPDEAPIRIRIHELFLEHKRFRAVAQILNKEGLRTRKGKPFMASSIERLLRDSTPKGIHRANYNKKDAKTKQWKLKPKSEWIEREVPPILSAELWDDCATILRTRDSSRMPKAKRPVHLFAGLLFCACGQKMYVLSKTQKYVCQPCRRKIAIEDLEGMFIEHLKTHMVSPDRLNAFIQARDAHLQVKQDFLDAVKREEKELRAEMEGLYRLYASGEISARGFGERNNPLEARLEQLNEEIPRLAATLDCLRLDVMSRSQVDNEARNLAVFWPSMSREAKRAVVENTVKRITYDNDGIELNLYYHQAVHHSGPKETNIASNLDATDEEPDRPTPIFSNPNEFSEDFAKRLTAGGGCATFGLGLCIRAGYRGGG